MPDWIAAPLACAVVGLAFATNRKLIGFLPDDVPAPGRKAHKGPTPLCGVALLPLMLLWLALAQRWWLGGAVLLVGLVGFLDDRQKERRRDFDWRKKALAQLVAAAMAAWSVGDAAQPGRMALAMLLVFVLTNATNFLDNTDGVATALSGASLLLLGGDGLSAIGFSAIGFLPWNWPRPWLFLGDAGAYGLGLCVGAGAAAHLPELELALLPVAVQLLDFVQVVCARLWLGYAPWIGDRRHLSHIAQNLGLPRPCVAPVLVLLLLLGWFTLAA